MSKEVFVAPVVSEKVYGLSTAHNRFAFLVPKDANKHSVARAVEAQYGVEVVNVAIVNKIGKTVRTYRNRRFTSGNRSDMQKAYVTLKEGHSLPIFAAIEEEASAATSKKEASADKKKQSSPAKKTTTKTTVKVETKAKTGLLRRRKSGDK